MWGLICGFMLVLGLLLPSLTICLCHCLFVVTTGSRTADMRIHDRAKAIGETEDMLKFMTDDQSGELLGGSILDPHTDDLSYQLVTAMHNRGTAESLYKSIHIQPTLSEIGKDTAKQFR